MDTNATQQKRFAHIRLYQPDDRDRVRHICVETGSPKAKTVERVRNFILTAFCEYYTDYEMENCFVLVDETGLVQGYILCAENAKVWAKRFDAEIISRQKRMLTRILCRYTCQTALKYGKDYPAHLHIDILPEYQNMGYGNDLIDTLISHLRAKGVSGLMLGMSPKNTGARRFYERCGFKVLALKKQETVMGIHI